MPVTHADIHVGRLQSNARVFIDACPPGVEIMAVVKADAYGHGCVQCVQALSACGIRFFAVATIGEAEGLRASGVTDRILVFAPPLPDQLGAYDALDVDLNLATIESVRTITTSHPELVSRCHLKIDTGMSRLGIQPSEAAEAFERIRRCGQQPRAAWTHLAHSHDKPDARSTAQVGLFRSVLGDTGLPGMATHVLNTGGFVHHPELRAGEPAADASWSRIGIGLYGIQSTQSGVAAGLRPVMRVVSRILQIKEVAEGTGVSYGHTWRADKDTRIATVGAGYADGVPRALSNLGWVGIAGSDVRCPVVGTVCMDMLMIDAGPADVGGGPGVGDEVVLMGDGGPSLEQVAHWARTISYEISTGIGGRVPRRYLSS